MTLNAPVDDVDVFLNNAVNYAFYSKRWKQFYQTRINVDVLLKWHIFRGDCIRFEICRKIDLKRFRIALMPLWIAIIWLYGSIRLIASETNEKWHQQYCSFASRYTIYNACTQNVPSFETRCNRISQLAHNLLFFNKEMSSLNVVPFTLSFCHSLSF